MTRGITQEQEWTFTKIRERTARLARRLTEIWPRPEITPGEVKEYALLKKGAPDSYVSVRDLIAAGVLCDGEKLLSPDASVFSGIICALNSDGNFIFADGKISDSPTGAAKHAMKMRGKQPGTLNGWTFWQVPRLGCKLNEAKRFLQTAAAGE